MAELREIAGQRADLLAETAGLALGTADVKGLEYAARVGCRRTVPPGQCRRTPDPAVDRGGAPPGGGRQAQAVLDRQAAELIPATQGR